MRILYYSPHPGLSLASSTGYGTHMREMIAAFERAGHEVFTEIRGGTSVSMNPPSTTWTRRLKDSAKCFIPSRIWESTKHHQRIVDDRKYEHLLRKRIEQVRPDWIYERSAYLQPSGVNVATQQQIPHVLEINTPVNAERHYLGLPNSHYENMAEKIEREQMQKTTLAAVVSPAMIDYFVDKHRVDPTRIICTPNGVDLSGISHDPEKTQQIRQRYQLNGNPVIGFVGCMAHWQRVDLLIEAVAKLASNFPNIRALLVGGDNMKLLQFQDQAKRLEISSSVCFTGSIAKSEVYAHIAAMDVCVLADNLWYGSPTKIFEYGAMRKPTVVPDNVTMRSIIEDGVHGRLVPSHPSAIAAAIEEFLSNPRRAAQIGEAFYARITNEFTWDANVQRIIEVITPILS